MTQSYEADSAPDVFPETISLLVAVRDELGLHARPAARLARAAQSFSSEITLEHDGVTADAKSILDILSLAAGRGASLTLRCRGADAQNAAETLRGLLAGVLLEQE